MSFKVYVMFISVIICTSLYESVSLLKKYMLYTHEAHSIQPSQQTHCCSILGLTVNGLLSQQTQGSNSAMAKRSCEMLTLSKKIKVKKRKFSTTSKVSTQRKKKQYIKYRARPVTSGSHGAGVEHSHLRSAPSKRLLYSNGKGKKMGKADTKDFFLRHGEN